MVRPICEIVARRGKGWQPHAASACVDVVGGNSRRFLGLLARLEVQLDTTTAQLPILDEDLPAAAKVEIHRLFSEAIRAGHATRDLSLSWDDELTRRAVETGLAYELEERVLTLYRLKTALPAGLLARVGAILGGGSAPQIQGLGTYFEAIGLAFQIMVDVLDVRGFEAAMKEGGGDIQRGTLTLPIVKALGMLAAPRREWLWHTLKSRPIAELVVRRTVYELEDIGALPACTQLARDLVEGAWQRLDPLLHDSRSKATIRGLGSYVLDWHRPS